MTVVPETVRFDHAIILVNNLKKAIRNFQNLGFHVIVGGELKGGAQNAIIPFEDGSYLELFSVGEFVPFLAKMLKSIGKLDIMTKGRSPMETRFIPHFSVGEGLIEFALYTEELENQLEIIGGRGLPIAGPIEGSRIQQNGATLHFRWGLSHAHLPFLISDITSRDLRVPVKEASLHKNGSTGIKELSMAVRDVKEATKQYSELLGVGWETITSGKTKFSLGQTDIILVGPEEGTDVQDYLKKFGERPFAIAIAKNTKDSSVDGMKQLFTNKVRISLTG